MSEQENIPFYQYKQFMIDHYGDPLFRVPIDAGYGCPNRAEDGSGGCAFCVPDGGRAVQTGNRLDIREQIQSAMKFSAERYDAKRWMAYLQAYTGTWASVSEQEMLYKILLEEFSFDAVSVGTRPDCLGDDVLDLLSGLNEKIEVWVEIGIQSANDATLARINRGHGWDESHEAVMRLKARGLKVAPHAIIGLPGEGADDFARTADLIAGLSPDGVKVHNLHVLRNTGFADEFEKEPFPVFDEYEYADFLIDFIRRMPSGIPVMRISTDSPEEELIAPVWTMKKGQFLTYVLDQMKFQEVRQGDLFAGEKDAAVADVDEGTPIATGDGSFTFWSEDYKDHYHSPLGARTEALEKFVYPSGIIDKLQQGDVRLLDVCFGLGYNSLCACDEALSEGVKGVLHVDALEIDRRVVAKSARHVRGSIGKEYDWGKVLGQLHEQGEFEDEKFSIRMHWGDARYKIRDLKNENGYDFVYLDGFSTQKNSEMWTVDFFNELRALMNKGGMLFTYSTALPVISGFMEAGFHVGETFGSGEHRIGTIAALSEGVVERGLSQEKLELIRNTPRGIPYRDPDGCWTNREILQNREKRRREQLKSL